MARKLDRRARIAIAVAVGLLLAGPAILLVKHVMAKLDASSEKVVHPEDDQLVMLKDGSTMLVEHGSTGRIMADWLKDDPAGVKSFDVGNRNFAPDSATLTSDGWQHVAQFAQLLKAHHDVTAELLYSPHQGIPGTEQLEHMRADRIHDEALHQGVDEEQIKVAREGYQAGHNAAADEGLEVVLINRA